MSVTTTTSAPPSAWPNSRTSALVQVVLEVTGGYEAVLVQVLGQRQIAVAVVHPRQVRDFAKGIGKDAKTDHLDAEVLASFGQVVRPAPLVAKSDAEEKLAALVPRRSQLLDVINQENNRRQQTRDREIQDFICQCLEGLKKQLREIDQGLATCVANDTANALKIEILSSVKGVGPNSRFRSPTSTKEFKNVFGIVS